MTVFDYVLIFIVLFAWLRVVYTVQTSPFIQIGLERISIEWELALTGFAFLLISYRVWG